MGGGIRGDGVAAAHAAEDFIVNGWALIPGFLPVMLAGWLDSFLPSRPTLPPTNTSRNCRSGGRDRRTLPPGVEGMTQKHGGCPTIGRVVYLPIYPGGGCPEGRRWSPDWTGTKNTSQRDGRDATASTTRSDMYRGCDVTNLGPRPQQERGALGRDDRERNKKKSRKNWIR